MPATNPIVPLQASEGRIGGLSAVVLTLSEAGLQVSGYIDHCVAQRGTSVDCFYLLEQWVYEEAVSRHENPARFTGDASSVQETRWKSGNLQPIGWLRK